MMARAARPAAPRATVPMSLKEMEDIAIQEAVQRHQGNKQAAADELGISLKTLYNRLNERSGKKAA
jgi:two-component system NtrC family response regulator